MNAVDVGVDAEKSEECQTKSLISSRKIHLVLFMCQLQSRVKNFKDFVSQIQRHRQKGVDYSFYKA